MVHRSGAPDGRIDTTDADTDGRIDTTDADTDGRIDTTDADTDGRIDATEADTDVVFIVYDGIQALDLTGPWEVFHGANHALGEYAPHRPRYRLTLCSTDGRIITTESGLGIATTPLAVAPQAHTLLVPGGFGARTALDDVALVAGIAGAARRAERVVTVCTGAFVAAAAGLCDGRRVATHWAWAEELQGQFPALTVDPEPIYARDGDLWSSAGVTAGIDLALALVEQDHGADIAQTVARWLVMFLRRPGGQTQFAAPVWSERAAYEPLRAAQDLVDTDPAGDHRVGVLAARVGMSERHFTRCFTEQTGVSPARYVAAIRVEAARRQLESTSLTIDAIAKRCGFGSAETMRRTFTRRVGVPPDHYRQRFRRQSPHHTTNDERSSA